MFGELQEKEGIERAYHLFNVSKHDLLTKLMGDGEASITDDALEMIERHVYMAYPWNADISLAMDVAFSERMLTEMVER